MIFCKKLSLPVQLLCVVLGALCLGSFIPVSIIQGFYTFSLMFKEILCFMLPFIVFFIVLGGILSLKKNAPVVLVVLLGAIFLSNMSIALSIYGIMYACVPFLNQSYAIGFLQGAIIEPYFVMNLPVFHFTPEVVSVITMIYFLMDSFGTAANVMGDGALVIGVQKIVNRITHPSK
jgi:Na+/H+-dicarboxylate symporter